jgi:hypothetical protein
MDPERPSSPKAGTKTPNKNRRTLTIVGTVAFVIFLAGVIFWGSALSSTSSVEDTEVATTLTPEEESAELYQQALAAIQSGETTEAATLLQKSVALDPDNTAAADALARISADRNSGGSSGSSGGSGASDSGDDDGDDPQPPADPDEGWEQQIEDLVAALPASVFGYELGVPTALGPDATVPADPVAGGPVVEVRRALYIVHDYETPEAAQNFVDNVAPSAFPENESDVTVNGVAGYFGTDGTRLAAVAFARGRYGFEVILTSNTGSPGALLDLAVEAAEAFPETP